MRERNLRGTTCSKCKKYVAPRSGWSIKKDFGAKFVYHSKCYDQMVEDEARKLKERLKTVIKYPKDKD